MKKNYSMLLAAMVMAAGLFAGCQKEAATGLTPVTLSEVAHSIFYAPQYAAYELGYFEEEGIDLEIVNAFGADKVMTAPDRRGGGYRIYGLRGLHLYLRQRGRRLRGKLRPADQRQATSW